MAKKLFCDRCGQQILEGATGALGCKLPRELDKVKNAFGEYERKIVVQDADLCGNCIDAFILWWNKLEETKKEPGV